MTSYLLSETIQTPRQRENIFKVPKKKNPVNLQFDVQSKSSFKNEGKITTFKDITLK